MNYTNLLITSMLLASSLSVEAGQAKFTESLADAVKCSKMDGETFCGTEAKGKYSATAYISAETFADAGITFDILSDATGIEIRMGDFSFSSTLGEAVSHTLTANKLTAKWQDTHEVCNIDGVCKPKPVVDTTVSVSANNKGVSIKVSGSNKSSDNESFGQTIFAGICDTAGDGETIVEPIYLTVDTTQFSAEMTGTCKVKSKTVTKNGESFDLLSISIKGVASYLN